MVLMVGMFIVGKQPRRAVMWLIVAATVLFLALGPHDGGVFLFIYFCRLLCMLHTE